MRSVFRHVPNILTGLRLAAAPATAFLLFRGHYDTALAIFAAAGISDAVDGFLAKRFAMTSRLGHFLDPAADKALMLCAFVALAMLGHIPAWVTGLVVGRDLFIVAGVLIALAANAPLHIKPLIIGKISTVLQVAYIVMHLSALAFGFALEALAPLSAYVLAAVTLASGLSYAFVWWQAMRRARAIERA
jgi:cardiolipin synthase